MLNDLQLFNQLVEFLLAEEENQPVAKPIPPKDLNTTIDIQLNYEAAVDSEFIETLKGVIRSTPKTASKAFFNQLFGGRIPRATLGDLLAVMLNNSMYTFKVAGVQVGIEKEILNKVTQMIGYPKTSDGTLAPGGSMCNYMAMLMARDRFDSSIANEGVSKKLIAYTSETSHYSVTKNASFVGIGKHQVRSIKTNHKGELLIEDLKRQIEEDLTHGFHPFFVNATAGTTVLGAFDNVEAISAICKTYDLWLHLDGAYCGAVIFSDTYKHLVNGIELTDSFSFNAHKMLGTPLGCSVMVTRDKKHLYQSLSNDAEYLYQTDDDNFNLGKTSLQCGRRNDALKLWTLWKTVGTKGLETIVDKQFYLADVAREYIRNHPDYELYSFDDSISVCFNYKGISSKTLCTALYKHSQLMVGYGSFREDTFVRLVTINTQVEKEDVLSFFEVLEKFVSSNQLK